MQIAIYKTMLKSTGRVVYVGQTKKVNDVGTKYFGSGMNIRNYKLRQLKELFNAEVITTAESQEEANDLERYYIEYFCTLEEYGGLNIENGGLDGGEQNREDQSKPVLQFTKSGEFVAEYPSTAEAERQTVIHHQNISKCCNGKRYKSAGGFIWKYK